MHLNIGVNLDSSHIKKPLLCLKENDLVYRLDVSKKLPFIKNYDSAIKNIKIIEFY